MPYRRDKRNNNNIQEHTPNRNKGIEVQGDKARITNTQKHNTTHIYIYSLINTTHKQTYIYGT